MTKHSLLSLAAAAALVLTGCGGGGSTPTTSTNTNTTTPAEEDSATIAPVKQADALKTTINATGATNVTGADNTGSPVAPEKRKTVRGNIAEDTNWTNDTTWVLDGLVVVKSGATLTIDAGTTIAGKDGTGAATSYLIVEAGAKIMAKGTSTEPIVFTSEKAVDGKAEAVGQWGGVTIIGKATNDQVQPYEVNEKYKSVDVADSVANDNSGVLKHIKVLNSGITMQQDKEINGLSFIAVGSGTTIEDITVERSDDDCIEIWGGTVNLSNITTRECTDDQFDIDDGFSGTVTNLDIKQVATNSGNAAIEMSGDTAATFDGVYIDQEASAKEGGIFFKKDGIGGHFKNVTVKSATDNKYGAINSKGVYDADNTTFDNVVLEGANEYKITGDKQDTIDGLRGWFK
ncbi:MAG: hypothetical protein IE889_01685 [Campylobacterales bacterium]|nr:hypothetical protein [Campylobacterales bacterium]